MVKAIAGVASADVEGFVASLTQASVALGGIPARLEAARVHDVAFGKLVDAAKVRDAYHSRLPATGQNITEARELIAHMITQFGGEPVPDPAPLVTVPAQSAPEAVTESESESVEPEQAVSVGAESDSASDPAAPEQAVSVEAESESASDPTAPEQAVSAQADSESASEPAAPESAALEQAVTDHAPDLNLNPDPDPDPDPVTVSLPGPRTGQTADG